MEADHVPPRSVLKDLYALTVQKSTQGRKRQRGFSQIADGSGNAGLCRNVLKSDHVVGLTWGKRTECCAVR